MIQIREDNLSGEETRALLALHLAGMRTNSPPESVFALDLSGLQEPGIKVWTAWVGDEVAGVGALNMIDGCTGEIKSMRTHPDHVRKGVGTALLRHILAEARRRGLGAVKLETGSGPAFEPALALYRRHGFEPCGPFGNYRPSEFNQFMMLHL